MALLMRAHTKTTSAAAGADVRRPSPPLAAMPLRVILIVSLCLGASCGQEEATMGNIELELFDLPVRCDAARSSCIPLNREGAARSGALSEALSGTVFVSPHDSQHPDGVYIYIEARRPSGAVILVELDVSLDSARQSALTFREYVDKKLVFRSTRAAGQISIPALLAGRQTRSCGCDVGLLELRFSAPGEDGRFGTDDDETRRISQARFGKGPFCRAGRTAPITDSVEVFVTDVCGPASSEGDSGDHAQDTGCGFETEGGWDDDGYDDYDDYDGYDDWDDDDDDCGSGSGWEGDTYDDDDDCDSGWEGDTFDDDDDWGMDGSDASGQGAQMSCIMGGQAGIRARHQRSRIISALIPFALLGLFAGWLRRRG